MRQLVSQPTRLDNILDLILTNESDIILKIEVDDTVISDHKLLIARTRLPEPIKQRETFTEREGFASLDFFDKKIDWEILNSKLLKIDWVHEFGETNTTERLQTFLKILYAVCIEQIPKKRDRKRKSDVPRDRRVMMRKRSKLNKKLRLTNHRGNNKTKRELELIEYRLLESHKREARLMENRAVEKIRENPKYFFSYAKQKSRVKVPIGPLEEAGSIVTDPQKMSEVMQRQFITVFSNPKLEGQEIKELLMKESQGFT